jgi:hypothetical protein
MEKELEKNGVNQVVECVDEVHAETAQEMAERLQKEVDAYKEMVSNVKTQEELDELEKAIMVEMDEYDEYISGVRYPLQNDVVFEGKTYSKADVAGKIIYFISKIEQSWQYVLGLYELCKLWKTPSFDEITFGALDSTLRLLDQCKYKGMTEWRDILIVNEYMKSVHEQYAKDTTRHIALGHRHNAIISQRDLITKIVSNPEQEA